MGLWPSGFEREGGRKAGKEEDEEEEEDESLTLGCLTGIVSAVVTPGNNISLLDAESDKEVGVLFQGND